MARFILNGRRIQSQRVFWQEYVDIVQPEGAVYFGRNMAALNDALSGGPGWPGDGFVLCIENSAAMIENLGNQFATSLQEVFDHANDARLELM